MARQDGLVCFAAWTLVMGLAVLGSCCGAGSPMGISTAWPEGSMGWEQGGSWVFCARALGASGGRGTVGLVNRSDLLPARSLVLPLVVIPWGMFLPVLCIPRSM